VIWEEVKSFFLFFLLGCTCRQFILDEENNLFKVSGKQHVSFEVILVHNAMESVQQKVPPILLGAFEDIFD
jgi:hypothetical protein